MNAFIRNELSCSSITKLTKGVIVAYVRFQFVHTYTVLKAFTMINNSQVPSSIIFVKKMVQRCGVWQINCMTSQDQDQVSMKSNMFGFGGYSQMKF